MDLMQAITERHSVRQYLDKPIEGETLAALQQAVADCNAQSGLHIQLVVNEPKAFDSFIAHYGKFSGAANYIALIGKKGPGLEEACGYYGEKLALLAQTLGLNTCWAGGSYQKVPEAYTVGPGEKLALVIAVGYGATQGHPRKSKTYAQVAKAEAAPEWFKKGVEAALLAPTAVNQQKFTFTLQGEKVLARAGLGFFAKTDLGIVKYHFEIGAGKDGSVWA